MHPGKQCVFLWRRVHSRYQSDLNAVDACNGCFFGDVNTTEETNQITQNIHPLKPPLCLVLFLLRMEEWPPCSRSTFPPKDGGGGEKCYKLTFLFYSLLFFQMDLWRFPSSSSSPRRDKWFSTETGSLCSAPPPTWSRQWSCDGVTMAALWPRRRIGAFTWRKPCFTTAVCWPGTNAQERAVRQGGMWAGRCLFVGWPAAHIH